MVVYGQKESMLLEKSLNVISQFEGCRFRVQQFLGGYGVMIEKMTYKSPIELTDDIFNIIFIII